MSAAAVVVVVVGAVVMAEGNAGDGRRKDKRRRSIRGGRDEKQQERKHDFAQSGRCSPDEERECVRWIGASWRTESSGVNRAANHSSSSLAGAGDWDVRCVLLNSQIDGLPPVSPPILRIPLCARFMSGCFIVERQISITFTRIVVVSGCDMPR